MGRENSDLNEGHQIDFDKAKDNAKKREAIQGQINNCQTSINLWEDTIKQFPAQESKLRPKINDMLAKIARLERELEQYKD